MKLLIMHLSESFYLFSLRSKYSPQHLFSNTLHIIHILYGCETWSLTRKEEYRWLLFLQKWLKRITGPMRRKVKGRISLVEASLLVLLFLNEETSNKDIAITIRIKKSCYLKRYPTTRSGKEPSPKFDGELNYNINYFN